MTFACSLVGFMLFDTSPSLFSIISFFFSHAPPSTTIISLETVPLSMSCSSSSSLTSVSRRSPTDLSQDQPSLMSLFASAARWRSQLEVSPLFQDVSSTTVSPTQQTRRGPNSRTIVVARAIEVALASDLLDESSQTDLEGAPSKPSNPRPSQ